MDRFRPGTHRETLAPMSTLDTVKVEAPARYRITFDSLAQVHFICDDHMGGARCCLPNNDGDLTPLRFRTGRHAREWLRKMGEHR